MSVKCRKCRNEIVGNSESVLLDTHGERLDSTKTPSCFVDSLYFIEENSVSWIAAAIKDENWTKGKLNCPKCGARIGSFDFISVLKCPCGSHVQPSVHVVKSKIDLQIPSVNISSVVRGVS